MRIRNLILSWALMALLLPHAMLGQDTALRIPAKKLRFWAGPEFQTDWNQVRTDIAVVPEDFEGWQHARLSPGLRFTLAYRGIEFSTALRPYYTRMRYTTDVRSERWSGQSIIETRFVNSYDWDYRALRMPIVLGIMPDFRITPYGHLGIYLNFPVDVSYIRGIWETQVTTTSTWSSLCGCVMTTVEELGRAYARSEPDAEQPLDLGFYGDLGVAWRFARRHRLHFELRYSSGGRKLGEAPLFRQLNWGIGLGYGFRVF